MEKTWSEKECGIWLTSYRAYGNLWVLKEAIGCHNDILCVNQKRHNMILAMTYSQGAFLAIFIGLIIAGVVGGFILHAIGGIGFTQFVLYTVLTILFYPFVIFAASCSGNRAIENSGRAIMAEYDNPSHPGYANFQMVKPYIYPLGEATVRPERNSQDGSEGVVIHFRNKFYRYFDVEREDGKSIWNNPDDNDSRGTKGRAALLIYFDGPSKGKIYIFNGFYAEKGDIATVRITPRNVR